MEVARDYSLSLLSNLHFFLYLSQERPICLWRWNGRPDGTGGQVGQTGYY